MTLTNTNHESRITNHVGNETRENIMYNEETKATVGAQLRCANAARSITANTSRSLTALLLPLALLAAPQAVQAQCTPTPTGTEAVPTPAGGTVECQPGDYADGIHFDSLGDLTVQVPDGTDDLTANDGGVNVTGNGADNISWDSSNFSRFIRGTDGAVIDYSSNTGNIDINVGNRIFGSGSATHGIRAESAGSGNVTINTSGQIRAPSGGVADVEAISGTGDIVVNASLFRLGLIAETGGAGTITVDLSEGSGPVSALTEDGDIVVTGVSGRSTFTSQTGDITADLVGIALVSGEGGAAVTTQTDGFTTLNLEGTYSPRASNRRVGIAVQSSGAGGVVVNVAGDPDFDLYRGLDSDNPDRTGKGNGLNQLEGVIAAPFDFSGLDGGATITFERGSGWFLTDPDSIESELSSSPVVASAPRTVLSGGNDVINILPGAVLSTPLVGNGADYGFNFSDQENRLRNGPAELLRYRADFGAGENVLDMAGDLMVGSADSTRKDYVFAEMRLENLNTFNHSGAIWLGAYHGSLGGLGQTNDFQGIPDGFTDDILGLPGTHFVGELDGDGNPLGLVHADVKLGKIGQADGCGMEFRGDDKNLPVADCIDLRDGHATGRTRVVLYQDIPGDRGAYNPEGSVLVDVSGDNADQTDPLAFVIAPESFQYRELADGTGVIDKGLFFYTIAHDPAAEQYKLYGLPGTVAQQFPLLRQAANSLWRASTNAWFDRQVDQRDVDLGAGMGSGVWGRVTVGSVERDLITPIEGGGEIFEFDNSHTLDETTATVGWDLISRHGGGALVAGAMVGYTHGKLRYDESRNSANLEGMHAGVYGSVTQGGFYLDAALNLVWLGVHNDVPAMELTPDTAILKTDSKSTGARLEAGYRLMVGPVGIEPLAGLSWVKTKIDDIDIPAGDPNRFGGLVQFKKSSANNASAGLRLSLEDLLPNVAPTGVSLTVRAIDEIHGRAEVSVQNAGPLPAVASDELEGSFTQVTGSVNVTNPGKTLAGYVNVDVLTGDDYDANSVSAGVRYQW